MKKEGLFREMRRKRQALSMEETASVLYRGTSGVLAVSGDRGYPYAVPISYVYDGFRLYFHCAKAGHKLDAIRREAKASFCVVDQDQIVPEKFTTFFRSAIVFGRIHIVEDEARKREAIEKLAVKYAPESSTEDRKMEIDREWLPLCVLEMEIEHMSGKQAIELVGGPQKARQADGAVQPGFGV
ncbi:MAG: pyridoxamine 5'-phosphate oxidase family protein [Lachnospiraceae bacterium]|nr:pyridoxamine 5'-phosphate oxidase family protein [Lachnospiraceae bacterium]